jgi:hypothetical protein
MFRAENITSAGVRSSVLSRLVRLARSLAPAVPASMLTACSHRDRRRLISPCAPDVTPPSLLVPCVHHMCHVMCGILKSQVACACLGEHVCDRPASPMRAHCYACQVRACLRDIETQKRVEHSGR